MFLCSPLLREDFQFDEHIFQMGWLKRPTRLDSTVHPFITDLFNVGDVLRIRILPWDSSPCFNTIWGHGLYLFPITITIT